MDIEKTKKETEEKIILYVLGLKFKKKKKLTTEDLIILQGGQRITKE